MSRFLLAILAGLFLLLAAELSYYFFRRNLSSASRTQNQVLSRPTSAATPTPISPAWSVTKIDHSQMTIKKGTIPVAEARMKILRYEPPGYYLAQAKDGQALKFVTAQPPLVGCCCVLTYYPSLDCQESSSVNDRFISHQVA